MSGRPKGSRNRPRPDPNDLFLRERDPEVVALAKARRLRSNLIGEWIRACIVFRIYRVKKPKAVEPKVPKVEPPKAVKPAHTTLAERERRNRLIRAMRETHSVIEIARVTGYSRVRIHQILQGNTYNNERRRGGREHG